MSDPLSTSSAFWPFGCSQTQLLIRPQTFPTPPFLLLFTQNIRPFTLLPKPSSMNSFIISFLRLFLISPHIWVCSHFCIPVVHYNLLIQTSSGDDGVLSKNKVTSLLLLGMPSLLSLSLGHFPFPLSSTGSSVQAGAAPVPCLASF